MMLAKKLLSSKNQIPFKLQIPNTKYQVKFCLGNLEFRNWNLIGIYNLVLGILFTVVLAGCDNRQLYKDNRVMMGTFIEVTSPDKNAPQIVFDEISRIENLMSKYNPQSEVSQLNKAGKVIASPETYLIIKKAKEFCEISEGAFDITVAPLVDLWGFTDKQFKVPQAEKIKAALKLVGSNKILLTHTDNVIKFKLSRMKIDLGAIAKGYALDCAVNRLKLAGINSCLINAGGQIFCLGDKFGKPWEIAVKNPRGKTIDSILQVKDASVSTSGDYEQFFFIEGKRYAHIINPKTGYPAESGVSSVTVLAQDGLTADFLSTAIFVLGKEKGEVLAKKFPGVEVRITETE